MKTPEKKHPFSDHFVFQTEGTVAAETNGIEAGVRCVLDRVGEVSIGWQVPLSDADGIICLFIHRDDIGCPGDPLPSWTDVRPDLRDVIDAVAALHLHLSALGPVRDPILLTDIEGDEDEDEDEGDTIDDQGGKGASW